MILFSTDTRLKCFSVLLLALSLAFSSCIELSETADEAMGCLLPMSVTCDVSVEEFAETKCATDLNIQAPSPDDITFVVKDRKGYIMYNDKGLWDEPLFIPAGTYTVEASFGTNGFGAPAFIGSASGTVDKDEAEQVTVTLSLVNSLVTVTLDNDLKNHFTPETLTLKSDKESYTAHYGQYCYVPSGASLEIKLTGTNSAGQESSLTSSLSSLAAKTA